jgi:hypothetical protein
MHLFTRQLGILPEKKSLPGKTGRATTILLKDTTTKNC